MHSKDLCCESPLRSFYGCADMTDVSPCWATSATNFSEPPSQSYSGWAVNTQTIEVEIGRDLVCLGWGDALPKINDWGELRCWKFSDRFSDLWIADEVGKETTELSRAASKIWHAAVVVLPYWSYFQSSVTPFRFKGALCSFGEDIQTQSCDIHNINGVIIQTQ